MQAQTPEPAAQQVIEQVIEQTADQAPSFVHYLPIATTVLSAIFFSLLLRRWWMKRQAGTGSATHLAWWAFGVFAYGLGTALESAITLTGNTVALNKAWYIAGALLGGYPLAQGTVFLLLKRRTAVILTLITVPFIIIASVFVALSPVDLTMMQSHKPSGSILVWTWVRALTPFINIYAVIFLIGGAGLSAFRYAKSHDNPNRAMGNASIAFGAILPGIGGSMAKAGTVEALYIGELVGICFIWLGYALCVRSPKPAVAVEPSAE